jgi:L-asparaginase
VQKIGIMSLGGTITMGQSGEDGALPDLSAEDICAALPQLDEIAEVHCCTIRKVGSPSLNMSDLFYVIDRVNEWRAAGINSFVLLQGTDTLEETAFGLDLMLGQSGVSLVVTAAMRDPKQLGADGFANLLASARVALHPRTADMGVVVVINDEIHAARLIEKRHSFSLRAFQSPNLGPVGWIVESKARYVAAPSRLDIDYQGGRAKVSIPLVRCVFDMDDILVAAVAATDVPAVVIEGVGGGNVSANISGAVEALAQEKHVVICSRTGGGEVLASSYGEAGSAGPLVRAGCINGTTLDGLKARMLLLVLLADGADEARLREIFHRVGQLYLQ